jgi:16S rRNA processing protein RimM
VTDTYRVQDLVGFRVETTEGELLGTLMDVLPTGANDVFVVQGTEKEYLVPALKTVVLQIDLQERRIQVKLPEGLRELYEA